MIYKGFISFPETTLRQHLAVLRQHLREGIFTLAGCETTSKFGETTHNHQCCPRKIQTWRDLQLHETTKTTETTQFLFTMQKIRNRMSKDKNDCTDFTYGRLAVC